MEGVLLDAIRQMNGSIGYDVIIVCTSNIAQEKYWQSRLEATRGKAARDGAVILAVHEDWDPNGAGNGLGTLYAYVKARDKALTQFNLNLDDKISKGGSIAIYHTAGKGTRLAPLPGSENNNKPGVKLPSLLTVDGEETELTILEAVIRQTSSYAPHRKGRCSVFWGDQIFIPSAGTPPSGSHPADILAVMGPMPTEQEWKERGLDKYGLIVVNREGHAAQVEKVSYATAIELLQDFGEIKEVGPSLGSFSLSAALLLALLQEFNAEIASKKDKLDSDPHFWMPMTLPQAAYEKIMTTKGMTKDEACKHYERMQKLKASVTAEFDHDAVLGCINAGSNCYWWDYGQLTLYAKNNLLATQDTSEAHALRTFLQISQRNALGDGHEAKVDESSVVLASSIKKGEIVSSVCTTVMAHEVKAVNSVLVNVSAKKINVRNCVLYNVVDDSEEGISLPDGGVRADVFMPSVDKVTLISSLDTDGGKAWKEKLENNTMSFEEVHAANSSVDILDAQAMAKKAKISKT